MKTFLFYAWLLDLVSQQSSKRWAQLLFLLTIKIINRAKFFLLSLLYKFNKASDAFSFSSNKKGRSRNKAPNRSLPYLSDRWIAHGPFTVSHANQCIPCGVLCSRFQAVSSLFNYSWNQLLFRNPWSKMTVPWHFIHRNVQSTFTFMRAYLAPDWNTDPFIWQKMNNIMLSTANVWRRQKSMENWVRGLIPFCFRRHYRIFRFTPSSSLSCLFWKRPLPVKSHIHTDLSSFSLPLFQSLPLVPAHIHYLVGSNTGKICEGQTTAGCFSLDPC